MSVSFSLSGVTATVQNPDLDDKLALDAHQVVQPKASGGFYRFALAAATDTQRELKWSNLRSSELNDLQSFFENQAQGTLNEFNFTDERGSRYAAYFLNPTLEPVTVSDEAASAGSFVTGGDTVPTTVRSSGFYTLAIKLHLSGGPALTIAPTEPGTPAPTSPHTSGPTSPPTAPPEYALESDLVAHEDLTTAAHGGLIPGSALVISVGTPGSNSNVPSEAAVRTALAAAISATGAASDPAGAAAAVQTNLNTHAALTTTAHGGLIPASAAGADGGVATLDVSGHVPTSQLPSVVLGALDYQGAFDCSAGAYPASPAKGQYWVCSVAGTVGGVAYNVGDWLTYNGASWNIVNNQQTVSSVCGKVGAVALSAGDVGADAAGAAAAAQSAAESYAASLASGAEAAGIPSSALVTSVGAPGSDSNVPSEKAVRTAIDSAESAAESAAEAASDASGAAATVQGNLNTHAALTTTAHGGLVPSSALVTSVGSPGSNSNVPSEAAVRLALNSAEAVAEAAAEAASDASGSAATVQSALNTHAALTATAHGGIPQLANLGGGAMTIGGSGSNGSAGTSSRSDHTHALTNPGVAIGPSGSTAGDLVVFADTGGKTLADGGPPLTVANLGGGAETVGGAGGNGSAATAARSDHTHAITAWAHESNHLHGGSDVLTLPDTINVGFDGGSSAIAAGTTRKVYVSFACTINAVTIGHDTSATMQINVLTAAQGSLSGGGSSICGSGTKPNTSAAQESRQTSFTSWSATAIAAGTWLLVNVVSNDNAKETCVAFEVTRT